MLTVLGQVSFMPILCLAAQLCPEVSCPLVGEANCLPSTMARLFSRRYMLLHQRLGKLAAHRAPHCATPLPCPCNLQHASCTLESINVCAWRMPQSTGLGRG